VELILCLMEDQKVQLSTEGLHSHYTKFTSYESSLVFLCRLYWKSKWDPVLSMTKTHDIGGDILVHICYYGLLLANHDLRADGSGKVTKQKSIIGRLAKRTGSISLVKKK